MSSIASATLGANGHSRGENAVMVTTDVRRDATAVGDASTRRIGTMRFDYLPLSWLEVENDERYQRVIRPAWIAYLVANWDDDLAVTFLVSHRDGRYFVVDGQHRMLALRERGDTEVRVACVIFEGLVTAEEAKRFRRTQQDRKSLSSVDFFRSGLIEGDPLVHDVFRIVAEEGFNVNLINSTTSPTDIIATGALLRIYGKGKREDVLREVLRLVRDAFPGEVAATQGTMLQGLGRFVGRYWGKYDRTGLIRSLRTMTAPALLAEGNARRKVLRLSSVDGVAHVALGLYNRGRSAHRLDEWGDRG